MVYFMFLSDGGASKRRGPKKSFPLSLLDRPRATAPLSLCNDATRANDWKF